MMRALLSFALTFVGYSIIGSAQTEPPDAAKQVQSTTPHIAATLNVSAFAPPAPPFEKEVPNMRVDASVTVPAGNSHTLTILRGEASDLPDIPAPVVVEQRPPRQLSPEELARNTERRRCFLNFSAEVYENGVSILRWRHPDSTESYEAICGFDVNLLAGLAQFTSNGKIYQLSFIPPGVIPIYRRQFSKLPIPKPPEAAPNSVTIIRGNAKDPIGTATATLLRDLIANEKSRLITYQQKRAVYHQAAAEWEKAHPPVLRNETVWLRPHRGSRYLGNPTPEKGTTR